MKYTILMQTNHVFNCFSRNKFLSISIRKNSQDYLVSHKRLHNFQRVSNHVSVFYRGRANKFQAYSSGQA